jgi:hypothetical protein
MNFGYLIIVSTSDKADYLKMAYALALSIKNTQKPGFDQVALVIDDIEQISRVKSQWVFDHVIEWNEKNYWDGRSYMDKLSPFENTVCLDADMLFLNDTSHWIEYFIENCELYCANKVFTYRKEIVQDIFYRQAFIKNDLPNLYSMYTFFKNNSSIANDFFELGRSIIADPETYKNLYLSDYKPKILGTDEAFALSAKILDITDEIAYELHFPKVVHFKPMIQGWPWPADKSTDHVGFYFSKSGNLKIGNYQQQDIIHYVEKDLVTDEVVSMLEETAWKKD